MSKATVVRDPKSGELYVLTRVKENGNNSSDKAPDKTGNKPTLMMARLQLHSDPNMNTDSRLGSQSEPESPQSPGADSQMSFNVYEGRLSGSVTSLGELPNSASTIGFLPEHRLKGRMVSWYSRRIRQLSVFLAIFVLLSLVMTGLFIWRVAYYSRTSNSSGKCSNCTKTSTFSTNPPTTCPVRAKAIPLHPLPKSIKEKLLDIERTLSKKVNDYRVSILANVVYMDQVLWSGVFGQMNKSDPSAPKLSNRTVFPIASGTKILTALMLYKLYYEKKIKTLDEPLVKYLPGFSVKDPFGSHDIVLREIVSHMSGLPREAPCFPDSTTNLCPINNSVILDRVKEMELIVRPGSEVSYSNLGFGLLGQGLARSQNTTYEDWMQDNIFEPLGMMDSGFKLTPQLRKKIPEGYLWHLPQQPKEWGWANPSGGLFTSLADIAKLEIKLFNSTEEDDFLSPLITEEFFSPAFILQNDQFIGSPWEMMLKNGYLARTKSGYVYGYQSTLLLFPELKLALNILHAGDDSRDPVGGFNLALELLSVFHEHLVKYDGQQQPLLPQDKMAPFLGVFYTNDVPTISKVIIVVEKGHLSFRVNNDKTTFRLNHLKGTTFELIDNLRTDNCLQVVVMGINHEKVYFDAPLNTTKISPGFTIFGIHLRGKAYFYRKR